MAKQVTSRVATVGTAKLRILIILLIGCILAFATYWLSSAYLTRKKIEAYAISETRKDIELVASAIQTYLEDKDKLPFKPLSDEEFIVSAKAIYPTIFNSKMLKVEMVEPPIHWKTTENIVDRWNNELNIVVKAKQFPEVGESVTYYFFKIWSNGPNQINDNGDNDDIIENFIIPVWVEIPQTIRPVVPRLRK